MKIHINTLNSKNYKKKKNSCVDVYRIQCNV